MAALAADVPRAGLTYHPRGEFPYAATADTYYADGLVGLDPATGLLVVWSNTAGLVFKGLTARKVVASSGDRVEVNESGLTKEKTTVTGASAQTDVDKPVYCSTDNPDDLTLTPTSNVGAVGVVTRWYSSTTCDVRFFTPEEYSARLEAGRKILTVPVNLASITGAGDVLTTLTPGFRGRIVSIDAFVKIAVTTAAKAATLNMEIGTTNLTGGTVALTSANCTPLGAKVAGAAITANNVFDADDTISIEAASVTAFAEGEVILVIVLAAD